MVLIGLVLAGLAALVHVFIFVMESLMWTGQRARSTFGFTEEEAQATKEMAFNQGFYNLFLAVVAFLGIILHVAGAHTVGATLVLTGTASMAGAALVLLLSSPDKAGAALKQGVIPALAVLFTAIGLAQ